MSKIVVLAASVVSNASKQVLIMKCLMIMNGLLELITTLKEIKVILRRTHRNRLLIGNRG